jgi:RNA polymerase sigma-70 factor, ECF subfamily
MEACGVRIREREKRPRADTAAGTWSRDDFAALVREQDHGLRMLAYRLLGDAELMDDVLQEAYLRAYKALPGFREEAAAATWLYRITYNVCMDHLRNRQRAGRHLGTPSSLELLSEEGFEPAAPHDEFESLTERQDLERALDALPVDQRAAVLLVDALGYDYRAAAGILGVREGTLGSRLHQARSLLRRAITHDLSEEER